MLFVVSSPIVVNHCTVPQHLQDKSIHVLCWEHRIWQVDTRFGVFSGLEYFCTLISSLFKVVLPTCSSLPSIHTSL